MDASLELPDLGGRLAIVTGANSGLGWETARRLGEAGATVVLAVRDPDKGTAARDRILAGQPDADLRVEALDLAEQASVHAFAARIDRPVDLLVLNAGVMAVPARRETVDGFELQLATNYLGHFALTGLLLPRLLAAPDPAVVSLSSLAHRTGRIDLGDLQGERRYGPWRAYGQSKLAMLMFALHLDKLARTQDWELRSNAAHPGLTRTGLQHTGPQLGARGLKAVSARVLAIGSSLPVTAQDPDMGVLPTLYAAMSRDSGAYFGPGGVGEITGHPKRARIAAKAHDAVTGKALWERAERLTGVSYEA